MLKHMRRGHVGKTTRALVEEDSRAHPRRHACAPRSSSAIPARPTPSSTTLVDFVQREPSFDRVGVFTYSNEEGTHAAKLAAELGAVPAKEMERRRRELMRVQRQISRKKMKAMVGRELDVLVEGPSEESEYLLVAATKGRRPRSTAAVFLALADDVKPRRDRASSCARA